MRLFVVITLIAVKVIVGKWDPEDDIAQPMKDFVELWKTNWGDDRFKFKTIDGHNHISSLMLMSGEGEQWGEDVVKWIRAKGVI